MPAIFVQMLWGGFLSILENIVGRVIMAAGFASITYLGMGHVVDQFIAHGRSSLLALPADLLNILGLLRVGEVFSMYSSALMIKLTYMHGLENGSIKRYGRRR
mgnify:CR=1 FL=1